MSYTVFNMVIPCEISTVRTLALIRWIYMHYVL